jgi:hypothetical protein
MKKLFLIAALILIAGTSYCQTFNKGNRFTLHVITVTPSPNVTVDQFFDFFKNKINPELEKNMPGVKCYVAKGVRGECLNCFSFIRTYKSKADQDKYFNEDGSSTEIYKAINEKLKSLMDELGKLGTYTAKNTVWEIQ